MEERKILIIGTILVMLTDLGAGITIASIMGKLLGMDLPFYVLFIFAGMFFALLPDYPVFFLLLKKKSLNNHKGIDHYPLFIIPCAIEFVGVIYLLSIFWPAFARFPIYGAILVALCMLSHLIHDSFTNEKSGAGIQWLAPFSKKWYTFFSRKKKGERRKPINFYYEEEARDKLSREKPYLDGLKEEWLKPTFQSVFGMALFAGAIIFSSILFIL